MSLSPAWTNGIIIYEMIMLGAILTTLVVLLIGAGLPNFRGVIADPEVGNGKFLWACSIRRKAHSRNWKGACRGQAPGK